MFKNIKEKINVFFLTMYFLFYNTCPVLAGNIDEAISTKSTSDVERRIFGSTKQVIKAFGGAAIGIGLGLIAFKLILCHKKPELRSEAMESIMWIGGGAILLGGIAIFTGFFWGTFGMN